MSIFVLCATMLWLAYKQAQKLICDDQKKGARFSAFYENDYSSPAIKKGTKNNVH